MVGRTVAALMALALAGWAAPEAVLAQPAPTVASTQAQRADALLTAYTPDKPGLAVLVMKGGQPVYERYLGAADLEHGQPQFVV